MLVELLLLLCLVLSAYGVGRAILPARGEPSGSHAITALFLGLLALTFCYILLAAAEYANRLSVSILVLGTGAGAWALPRNRRSLLPGWSPVLLVVGALIALPTVLQGLMMSGGSFPPVFYNVDNAYFLQFVHSFLELGGYPPPRLDNYALPTYGYHYGVMALGALIAQFTGMAPHTAFLMWVPVLGIVVFVGSINALLKTLGVDSVRERALMLIVLAPGIVELEIPTVSRDYLVNLPLDAAKHLLKTLWRDGIEYGMEYRPYEAHFATLYGLALCLVAMSFTLDQEQRRRALAYVLTISLMPLVKTPYMGFLGIGIGCYAIYRFVGNRDWKEFLVPALAGAWMLAVFSFFGASRSAPTGGFLLGFPGSLNADTRNTVMLFLLASAFLLAATGLWRRLPGSWTGGLWFFLPLLVLGLFMRIDQRNAGQLFALVPWMAAMYLALITVRGAASAPPLGKLVAAAVLLPWVLVSSLGLGNYAGTLLSHPEAGYEYVDNRPLADVLEHLPTEDSLLVTNDLRYPADDFSRDNRQFQLAALFGHRAFNAELDYSRGIQTKDEASRSIYADRLNAARVLSKTEWDADAIDSLLSRYPITHLLIHRPYPHPKEIPLELIAENSRYRLYSFKRNKAD